MKMISYDISRLILSARYDQYIALRLNYDTCIYIHSLINLKHWYLINLCATTIKSVYILKLDFHIQFYYLGPVDDNHYICAIEIIMLVMELRILICNESHFMRKTKGKACFDGASFQFISDIYCHWKLQND